MNALPTSVAPNPDRQTVLHRFARLPNLRALAWSGDILYASRGYELLRAPIQQSSKKLNWQSVAAFCPAWRRTMSVRTRLSARLFRDGFHALTVLPSGGLVAVVPGAIVTQSPGKSEFRKTFTIIRGTRPLHITAVPNGAVFWGEYFDNASRDEVHIYGSSDSGATWNSAYTFPKGAIRHVHNIVHDPWQNCLWVLTGDYGEECRILRAALDFSRVDIVLQGKQQARSVAAVPTEDGLYFSSDTPFEQNFIYRLDREGKLSQLTDISGSSIYACRVASRLFFSTMVEPSDVNHDGTIRVYGADITNLSSWQSLLAWQKDRWPMGLLQYGNAIFPNGDNRTPYLALTTVAVESDDMVTSLYSLTR